MMFADKDRSSIYYLFDSIGSLED